MPILPRTVSADKLVSYLLAVEDVDQRLKILQEAFIAPAHPFNRDLPWGEIDMDFMNLNIGSWRQEHGFIMTRLRLNRKSGSRHWRIQKFFKDQYLDAAAAGWK
jgi:L-arabinose isomerase